MLQRKLPLLGLSLLVACGGEGPPAPAGSPSQQAADRLPDRPLLEEVTADWGLDFVHRAGSGGDLLFPEMMGGGIGFFDADSDGDLDLYLVSGAPELGRPRGDGEEGPVNRLFLQLAPGRFVDATEGSGLGDPGYGTGTAIGDFDNDGHDDVFLANFGPDRLFRGRGDGTFEDVSRHAGLHDIAGAVEPSEDWATSAAFCDYDRDGFLDLYIVRYVVYDGEVECTDKAGRREYCGPDSYPDRSDVLLRNRGDGTFAEVTAQAGIDAATGAGLGVVCQDMDDDGWVDIYVANDGDPNQLWVNQRDGTFLDDALIMGASVNAAGLSEAGMGVVAADFDNDTDLDLFLTHLRDETNTFYRNLGPGIGFEDQTARVGLTSTSAPYTGFGTAPFDLDLDGDLDLVVANGRVTRGEALTDELGPVWSPYAEPNLVYLNEEGRFVPAPQVAPSFVDRIEISRGLAVGDLNGDGRLDLAVGGIETPVRVYRGTAESGHWLLVDGVDPRLRRRALGARITVTSGDLVQTRSLHGAMSYLSASDPRAHFGFGDRDAPVTARVRWPDGLEETFRDLAVDQAVVLRRGEGES